MTVGEQDVRNPAGFWIRFAASTIDGLLILLHHGHSHRQSQ